MNQANNDILLPAGELDWVPMMDGIRFKLLRSCDVTGTWTVLFSCDAGSFFPRHQHYGAGEYYVIQGEMRYRAGTAHSGDYGYEPLGSVHDRTDFAEYTELYFTNFGPVVFLEEDDTVASILDGNALQRAVDDNKSKENQ